MENRKLHFIAITSFIVFIVLGLACASTPMLTIELSEDYHGYLLEPRNPERRIDTVNVRGNTHFVCRDPNHAITSAQRLGAPYQVSEDSGIQRHRHEIIFVQLLNEAKRHYPSENVNIKNARTARHNPTNARREEYTAYDNNGGSFIATRTVWDCFPVYVADIITTARKPEPVNHDEVFTFGTATPRDIYNYALRWLEENTQRRRITIQSEDIQRLRITGTVTCFARADQSYIVTSVFNIYVFDAGRIEITFRNTELYRTNAAQQIIGNPEEIFLQSIADAALAEIVDFSTSLRSNILSRL